MALTIGRGPFGDQPAGVFNFRVDTPAAVMWFEDSARRIRAIFERQTVVDSLRTKLLHESGRLPVYYFPEDTVRTDLLERTEHRTHCPHKGDAAYWSIRVGDRVAENAVWSYPSPIESASFLAGYLAFRWNEIDEWFAEDEQIFGHARDPYSRIDILKTSRHVRVSRDGVVLADTRRAKVLYETPLPPRWYIPPEDVRLDLLVPSSRKTRCAYKGSASYWSVRVGEGLVENLVWSYPQPEHDAEPVRDMLCFFNEHVDLEVDGELAERPRTQWSGGSLGGLLARD